MVRDSAGIRIVENYSPPLEAASGWSVDPTPVVRIGEESGPASQLLVMLRGAARLDDDRMVILDGGTRLLQFYDDRGELLHVAGGRGQGPGEFGAAVNQLLRLPGDTLLVVRVPERQVSRFDGGGNYVDQSPFDQMVVLPFLGPYRPEELVHFLPDRSLLSRARRDPSNPTHADLPGGFVIVSLSGERGALLEPFPPSTYQFGFLDRESLFAAGGDPLIVALGNSERYEVSIYTTAGQLKTRVRNIRPNDPVRRDELDQYARLVEERAPSPELAAQWRQTHNETQYPTTYPAFDALFVDRTSHLWIRSRFPRAYDRDVLVPWEVYDAEGGYVSTVRLPGMIFAVYDIGEDFILAGVIANEFGAQEVHLYGLDRR